MAQQPDKTTDGNVGGAPTTTTSALGKKATTEPDTMLAAYESDSQSDDEGGN